MYTQFFGLKQAPFSIAPDPRYLFMSERHREALAHLLYGVESGGGFVLLTGEIGAGKTTVCRCFLQQIPANCNVAYIFNPKLTVVELLQTICEEFRIDFNEPAGVGDGVKTYVDALNRFLLQAHARGENNVLIIDEAQNLSAEVLEQLRLLTNLETNDSKLLQIVLIGQPELRGMLAEPQLRQLAQRIIARYHLESLSLPETAGYIRHRLSVAGMSGTSPIADDAVQQIHRRSMGVPRRINVLTDRALLGAYVEGKRIVDRGIVAKAAAEVFDSADAASNFQIFRARRVNWPGIGLGLAAAAAIVAAAGWNLYRPPAPAGSLRTAARASQASAPTAVVGSAKVAPTRASASGMATSASAAITTAPAAQAGIGAAGDTIRFDAAGEYRNETEAVHALAQMWGVTIDGDTTPCAAMPKAPLRCYRSMNGLSEIRQLDRPVLVTLRDDNDRPHFALLIGLSGDRALLQNGGATQSVSLPALARQWRGDFTTLWRIPPGYHKDISLGDGGPAVDWLATRMAAGNRTRQTHPGQPFELTLRQQVREFQLAHGLSGDGVAGPKTLMLINAASSIDEPRLHGAQPAVAIAPAQ